EETLRSGAAATVAGAIAGALDLTSSRRLNLAAAARRTPLVVLRGTGAAGASAAATRWRIAAAPAARDRFGGLAAPRWHVALERCRNGRPGQWLIEWNHVAHRFRVVERLADRPPAQGASLRRAG
ncbi:MAG TPA: ImuA protein, partial [Methylomirabilota bacterium]|nr:ImuA protein [Methylomirabilota bacterium]